MSEFSEVSNPYKRRLRHSPQASGTRFGSTSGAQLLVPERLHQHVRGRRSLKREGVSKSSLGKFLWRHSGRPDASSRHQDDVQASQAGSRSGRVCAGCACLNRHDISLIGHHANSGGKGGSDCEARIEKHRDHATLLNAASPPLAVHNAWDDKRKGARDAITSGGQRGPLVILSSQEESRLKSTQETHVAATGLHPEDSDSRDCARSILWDSGVDIGQSGSLDAKGAIAAQDASADGLDLPEDASRGEYLRANTRRIDSEPVPPGAKTDRHAAQQYLEADVCYTSSAKVFAGHDGQILALIAIERELFSAAADGTAKASAQFAFVVAGMTSCMCSETALL